MEREDVEIDLEQQPSVDGMREFAELMVKDDENIPNKIRSDLWGFINKGSILSRSDDKDKRRFENRFCIARNLLLMMQPANDVTLEMLLEYHNTQNSNTVSGNRSYKGFERGMLATQIREIRQNRIDAPASGGILSGLKTKLGFGPKKEREGGENAG